MILKLSQLSHGRGRSVCLTQDKELIVDAALEFQQSSTPLDYCCLRKLARTFISTLLADRQAKFGFKEDLPALDWQKEFFRRRVELSLRREVNIEHE